MNPVGVPEGELRQALEPVSREPRTSSEKYGGTVLVVALSLAAVAASVLYCGVSHGDDTFIYLRYVKNFVEGSGLTYNVGEPSYGVTSFLWALLLAGPSWALGPSVWLAKAASWSVFAIFAMLVWRLLLGSKLSRPVALALGACVVLEPHLLRWSGSGMENSLVALAVLLLIAGWPKSTEPPSLLSIWAACAGLAPLVRPELAILVAALFLEWVVADRLRPSRDIWRALSWTLLTFGLAMLLSRYAMGSWLPQAAEAKRLALHQADPTYAIKQIARIIGSGALPIVLLAISSLRSVELRRFLRPALIYTTVVTLYLALQNQLVATRYGVSLEVPIVVALAVGLARAPRLRAGTAPMLLAQLVLALSMLVYLYPATRVDEGGSIRPFAESARALTTASDCIALSEVGAFGFFSERYIIDSVGLVDRAALAWIREHGRPRSTMELEAFLEARCATHYVESFGAETPLSGRTIRFQVLAEQEVTRSNLSNGTVKADRWRLYRLEWKGCGSL